MAGKDGSWRSWVEGKGWGSLSAGFFSYQLCCLEAMVSEWIRSWFWFMASFFVKVRSADRPPVRKGEDITVSASVFSS